ncbi:MAG: hypothetical protein Kow00105_14440 [Phycisphaeraceae bacterium]
MTLSKPYTTPVPEEFEQMLCPHCMEPADPISHFCPSCGGPISQHATIDPMGQIYAQGHAYRNSTGRPTRLMTVIGVWLIFGTQIPLLGFAGIANPLGDPAVSLFSLVLAGIYGVFVYKTTSRYIRATRCQKQHRCFRCGYDLSSTREETHCPRCGDRIDWLVDEAGPTTDESSQDPT